MRSPTCSSRQFSTAVAFIALLVVAAPVRAAPTVSAGVTIPKDKGYYLGDLGQGLYWVTDGFYTSMFLTTGKGVIVVDAPPTIGKKLLDAIASVTKEKVAYVVYSHSHADHIGSAGLFPSSAKIVAQIHTKERLARVGAKDRAYSYGVFVGGSAVPMPTITFDEEYTLQLGTQVLKLRYDGDDHEPGNIYIYAPKQKVLMKVDIVFPGWAPFEYLAIAEDTFGYIGAMDKVLAYDFTHLVSGHWNRLATRADVETQKEYIKAVTDNAATALKSVDFYAIAGKIGSDDYGKLFQAYIGAVTDKCTALTVPAWKDKLGGVEALTATHCHQLIMALRVD